MSAEAPGPKPHEQVTQAFEQAFDTAQGSEMPSGIDRPGASSIEWVGQHNQPHLQRSEQPLGGDQVIAVSNKHGKGENQRAVSMYETRYNEANDFSPERARVRIRRIDSQGNSYSHEFKKPETAAKFVELIGRHSMQRAAASKTEKAA